MGRRCAPQREKGSSPVGCTVGIDLGTTNSAVACVDATGNPVTIRNSDNSSTTPSVISFCNGEILIGDAAKEMQALGTCPVAAFFKREIGDPLFLFHAEGVDYTAIDLSAMVLRKLKVDAESDLGEPIRHAVITVPAYFRDAERKATIAAGEAAGLEVLQVINEPTAAAVAYGVTRAKTDQRILVYDLGGGTFDVTLLDLMEDAVRVRSSDGDHQLGGRDWDDRIIEFLATRFHEEFGVDPLEDSESLADLLVQAEEAKKRLTAVKSTTVSIVHGGFRGRYSLERARFEELTADLMERTVSLMQRLLDDVRLEPKDIDGVLTVGGSTRMPMVHKQIECLFGRSPMGGVNVDEVVALGAAAVAAEHMAQQISAPTSLALRGPTKVVDVTNHSLGMIAVNGDRTAYVNSIILAKSAEIPCEEVRPYQHRTRRDGDNRVEVFMTQGESEAPLDVGYIGKYVIHGIPHQPSGIAVIDVAYRYDRSGTVEVAALLKKSQEELAVTVEALPPDVPERFLASPQSHEVPAHLTAYLAFDVSGSMVGESLDEAKRAARGFLGNTDLNHCSLGVIAFSDSTSLGLEASQNARAIERTIGDLEVGGGTNGEPFTLAHSLLQNVEGRRFIIVLTDGHWYEPGHATRLAKICHADGIDVIAIGFGEADREFLRAIASSDEASFTPMNRLVETFSGIAQVLTETGGALAPDGGGARGRLSFLSGIGGSQKR